jgi:hypothetical protein
MLRKVLVLSATLSLMTIGHSGVAIAAPADSAGPCGQTGYLTMSDVPVDYDKLVPSTKRYLVGVGRAAVLGGCIPQAICGPESKGVVGDAKQICENAIRAMALGAPQSIRIKFYQAMLAKFGTLGTIPAGNIQITLVPGIIERTYR